jgi:hypothetical protein
MKGKQMSWKPEVFVQGKWSRNGLVFATEQEAADSARNLMYRWILVEDSRAVEVDEPVNYRWRDGQLEHVKTEGAE